jgi:chromosome segregation ATPase
MDRLRQDIVTLRIDLNRTNEYPAMLEKTQQDLSSQFETLKDQLRREKADTERLRQAEIEGLNQQLADVDKRLRILPRLEERLQAREAGEQQLQTQAQQLTNSLADLSKRAEDRFQSVVYLEEQRRADARRIAAIEGDIPPLRKATDESIAKTVRLEDSLRKLTSRIEEAVQTTKTYDAKIEELRVADFQREQRMRQYAEQAAKVETETSRLLEQTQKYALLYNQNKQAMDGLESFRARLEKRQNEIAEMQRLNEERWRASGKNGRATLRGTGRSGWSPKRIIGGGRNWITRRRSSNWPISPKRPPSATRRSPLSGKASKV